MPSTPAAWIPLALIAASLLLLCALEALMPLRPRREGRARRWLRNGGTGAIAWAVARPLQGLLLVPLAAWLDRSGIGLLQLVELPALAELLLGLLLFDATLWYWHWANHRVGLLWRFHSVHHEDPDLDATTALRFHFGELGLSVGFRALQLIVIGASVELLLLHLTLLTVSALFHHSNLRLPIGLERLLVLFVVTPRMHGIHHSDRRQETDSNYSSVLSCWDRLHGTLVLNRAQDEVTIGIPGRDSAPLGLWRLQLLPFRRPGALPSAAPEAAGPRSRLAG